MRSRWADIWSRLTPAARREAAEAQLEEMEKVPQARDGAIRFLAQELGKSSGTVAKWSLERRAQSLAEVRNLPPRHVGAFLSGFLIRRHRQMLTLFLDTAGVPHANGAVDPRTLAAPVPEDDLVRGVQALRAAFPPREVDLYLDALEAQETSAFARLHRARRAGAIGVPDPAPFLTDDASLVVPTALMDLTSRPEVRASTAEAIAPAAEPLHADVERLSPLDDLVLQAALAAAAGIVGATPLATLREAVEELLRLNATRHRSYYHLGFLDVLQGRDLAADFPHASERHRGWYLCGALHALTRQGRHEAVVALHDRHPRDAARLLGARHEASALAATPLVEALLHLNRRADALEGLSPATVDRAGEPLAARLLDEARACLRDDRAAEALPILKLLVDGIAIRGRRAVDFDRGLAERVRLRHALALRLRGAYDRADAIYETLLDASTPDLRAEAAAGRGLVACKARSLADVRMPRRAGDLQGTARRLEAGRSWFESAAEGSGPGAVQADLCLGVLHVATGRTEEALAHLERALAAPGGPEALDEGASALERARLLLGVVLAESLRRARASEALEHLVAGVRAWQEEAHPYLIERALVGLAATRPQIAVEATQLLHEILGDGLLDAALDAGMLSSHEPLREALARWVENEKRSSRQRSADAEALLRDALAARDLGRAERALDALEALIDDVEARRRLLAILEDPARFDPAWRAEEALYVRVHILEAEGRYAEAAGLLCAQGHDVLAQDPERGLPAARGILERVEGYGLGPPDPSLVARVAALEASAAPRAATREPAGRIYFVGGNEVQARYEGWLREELARRWPQVSIAFHFSGWSSNWGRDLETHERRVQESDVVVVMRFVRTMLGRTLRALCSTHDRPWVACTGHGRQSLLAALENAVGLIPPPSS